jgi:hypothetical protein
LTGGDHASRQKSQFLTHFPADHAPHPETVQTAHTPPHGPRLQKSLREAIRGHRQGRGIQGRRSPGSRLLSPLRGSFGPASPPSPRLPLTGRQRHHRKRDPVLHVVPCRHPRGPSPSHGRRRRQRRLRPLVWPDDCQTARWGMVMTVCTCRRVIPEDRPGYVLCVCGVWWLVLKTAH